MIILRVLDLVPRGNHSPTARLWPRGGDLRTALIGVRADSDLSTAGKGAMLGPCASRH